MIHFALLAALAGPLDGSAVPAPAAPAPSVQDEAAAERRTVPLEYRGFRQFEFELPQERFAPVGDGIPIAHAGGDRFAARVEGGKLLVDVTGDGTFKAVVEAPPQGETANVTLRGRDADGEPVLYAARVRVGRSGWEYSCSGGLVGNVGTTKVVLLDQDLDGVYGEVGEDAIVVGRGRVAAPMSSVLLVDDAPWRASFADGALELEPFDGPTGVLDLRSGFVTDAKVLSLQVSDHANGVHLDLARYDEGARVPVGEYALARGRLASGDNRVTIAPGRAEPLTVRADERTEPSWGGPIRAEFEFARVGTEYRFSPDAVWYYGRAGEQYLDWTPLGPSPRFVLVEEETRAELASGVFPGT